MAKNIKFLFKKIMNWVVFLIFNFLKFFILDSNILLDVQLVEISHSADGSFTEVMVYFPVKYFSFMWYH